MEVNLSSETSLDFYQTARCYNPEDCTIFYLDDGEELIEKYLEGSCYTLILRHYFGVCLERLRKTIKNFTEDSQILTRHLLNRSQKGYHLSQLAW
jgi:hypothetical protein